MINKNSAIPVYYQLKEKIRDQIKNGIYKVGDCISSERELSEHYGVSRMTVRQAIGELVSDGMLYREKGKGTFVCDPKVKQEDLMSFTEIINRSGRKLETKVISLEEIITPEELLGIFVEEKIYKINRLRFVDEECIANEIVHVPKRFTGELNEDVLKGSIYKILEKNNITINYVESSIQAILMDRSHMEIFKVNKDIPLIKTINKSKNSDDKVVFYEEATYRSDKYILEVNISKREGKLR
ncbi:MAG: GntR family transcriptional regulator [Clostridium sp.]